MNNREEFEKWWTTTTSETQNQVILKNYCRDAWQAATKQQEQRIAERESQKAEPVAWTWIGVDMGRYFSPLKCNVPATYKDVARPLYTTPPTVQAATEAADSINELQQCIAELESQKAEPFGYWHQGETMDESDFFLTSESGDVSCRNCVKLYTTPPSTQAAVEAAYVKAEEECLSLINENNSAEYCSGAMWAYERIRALSGTDALRDICMRVANAIVESNQDWRMTNTVREEMDIVEAIVDRVIKGE